MAYESHDFYPYHLGVFNVKIVVSLLSHKEGNVIFRIIVFYSFSQQSGIRSGFKFYRVGGR